MDFGFVIPSRGPVAQPAAMTNVAQRGEALGFRLIGASDHVIFPVTNDSTYPYSESGTIRTTTTGENLEQLTLLAYLAGQTTSARLLTSVMVVPHRPPILAAKTLATIDVLSGGRLVVGCGVGWLREEFDALQVPPFDARGKATDEYLEAFRELWTAERPTYDGAHVRFSNVLFAPKPAPGAQPPLWIGGESPAALRRVARLGDGWYPIGSNPTYPMDTPERLGAAIDLIRREADARKRDPATIEYAYNAGWYSTEPQPGPNGRRIMTGARDDVAQDIEALAGLGFTSLIVGVGGASEEEMIERMERFAQDFGPLSHG